MVGNREVYEEAFRRAAEGKRGRSLLDLIRWPFEDEYTRQSRQKGERDGAAARSTAAAEPPQTMEPTA